jgi:mono/diheme cytochrome c family protein
VKTARFAVLLAVTLVLCGCSPRPARKAAAGRPASTPLSYEMRLGRATYQHYCQNCHGETGAGDGFNAFNLDPRPRDLSEASFQKKKTDAELADAIQRGGSGVGLSSMMPPWGHTLTREQVNEVVLYLRSFEKHTAESPNAPTPSPTRH